MHITVYKCSRCGKMHYDASNMRKHIANICQGSTLEKQPGVVVVPSVIEAPPEEPRTARIKPGPKPLDLNVVLRGRIPAFSEHGDDERIEYIFGSNLIERLLQTTCEDIPSFLFEHAWSSRAPEHMQSLVLYRNTIHEVQTLDDETGEVTYLPRGTLTKRFIKDMAVYTLELAYAIAKDSVIMRAPELRHDANRLLARLREQIDGVSLRNAIKHNHGRKNMLIRRRVEATLSKLNHVMTTLFPSCFT